LWTATERTFLARVLADDVLVEHALDLDGLGELGHP
jgi:hypothetical protein